jgi:hypothetical protein
VKIRHKPVKNVHDVKNARHEPVKNVHDVKNARHGSPKNAHDVKNARHTSTSSELSPLHQSLRDAGIGEPKRSALVTLPHVTPAYVKAWESQLKHAKGNRYSPVC